MTLLNHSVTHPPPPFPFFGPPSCLQPGSQYMFSYWYAFSFHMLTSMHLSRQKCFQIGRKQNTPWIRDFTYLFNLKKRTEFQTILMKYPNIKILHHFVMNLSHCQSHQEISMLIYTYNIKNTSLCTYKCHWNFLLIFKYRTYLFSLWQHFIETCNFTVYKKSQAKCTSMHMCCTCSEISQQEDN